MSENTQQIVIGKQTLEIETKPITMIFSSAHSAAGPRKQYPGCVEIDTDQTRWHGDRVVKLHPKFDEVWRIFFRSTTPPTADEKVPKYDMEARKGASNAFIHLIGLIDFTLKMCDLKLKYVWIFPESFMHPGWQVALGDLAIWFANYQPVKNGEH